MIDADKIEIDEECTFSGKGINAFLDAIPTDYDVDKVIGKIKDAISETPEYRHKFCGTVSAGNCGRYESCEDCMAERMIEIVKSGGVES